MKRENSFLRFALTAICIYIVWPVLFLVLSGIKPPVVSPAVSMALSGLAAIIVNWTAMRLLKADQRRTEAIVDKLHAATWRDLSYVLDIRGKYFVGPIYDAAGTAFVRLIQHDSPNRYVNLSAENLKTLVGELEPEQCYTNLEIVMAALQFTNTHVVAEAKTAVDRLSQMNVNAKRIRSIVLLARSMSAMFQKQASLESQHKHLLRPTEPVDTLLRPREGLGAESLELLLRSASTDGISDNSCI